MSRWNTYTAQCKTFQVSVQPHWHSCSSERHREISLCTLHMHAYVCLPLQICISIHICVFLHVCAVCVSACVFFTVRLFSADSLHSNFRGYYHWGWLKMYIIKTRALLVASEESLYQAVIILYYSWWCILNTLPSEQSPQILLSVHPWQEKNCLISRPRGTVPRSLNHHLLPLSVSGSNLQGAGRQMGHTRHVADDTWGCIRVLNRH